MKTLFKKEPVLTAAALCMILSFFFVPPDISVLTYIDFRVLALLFCLMAVVAGLKKHGLFTFLAQKTLSGEKNRRTLFLLLILLPFFLSMLITNDVALITFVPFAILILELTGQQKYLIFIIVFQTVAANLGSMATPVGNPQNLFLYSAFALKPADFFAAVLPYVLISLILLPVCMFFCENQSFTISFPEKMELKEKKNLGCYLILFLLCLMTVFHLLPYGITFGIVFVFLLVTDRKLLRSLDYGLLLTFVCFFIFGGNIGAIPAVKNILASVMESNPLLASAAASQVISNVPAAVLLAGFTENWKALLAGVNIGGLGTPIASLASLISFRLYMKTDNANAWNYLKFFLLINAAGLLILLPVASILL